jgi:hypothetical protein
MATLTRSPRAPRYSLAEAIGYVSRIYDGVHRSAIDATTAYQLMGFAGKSGTSATALGSVRQFGLVEGIGDRTRVSDLALRILEPASPDELHDALQEALRQPTVFKAIMERFDGRLPAANEPIRAFLIRDLGFSKQGAEECISALRTSIKQVGEPSVEALPSSVQQSESIVAESGAQFAEQRTEKSSNVRELIRLPLTKDCAVELRFDGLVTTKAIGNLIRHIDLMKDVWAED